MWEIVGSVALYGGIGLAVLILLFGTLFTVEQQTAVVIERFGKYARIARPGLNVKIPLIEQKAGRVNLRVQQLDVKVETKTEDNVFVIARVSVQYFVDNQQVYDAFYKLNKPREQMSSYVFDVVRARVPTMKLDDVFERKDDVADAVKDELAGVMDGYGYNIVKALVTDIDPDATVKAAMNEINAAQRERMAAQEKGEADKILVVKSAEAESESKRLQGVGIANQRKAIIEGLRESVDHFRESIPGASPQNVMDLVLITQWLDTLKDIGTHANTNTLLLNHSPTSVSDIKSALREATMVGQMVTNGVAQPTASGNGTTPHDA